MREIEFRGIGKVGGEWLYGDYLKFNKGVVIIPHLKISEIDVGKLEVIPDTSGQYIGITDIHGKKVFQGDIVNVKQIIYKNCWREEIDGVEEFTGEIILFQYGWYIAEKAEEEIQGIMVEVTRYHDFQLWNLKDDEQQPDTHFMEIIGNRWDDPEKAVIDLKE